MRSDVNTGSESREKVIAYKKDFRLKCYLEVSSFQTRTILWGGIIRDAELGALAACASKQHRVAADPLNVHRKVVLFSAWDPL